MICRLLSTGKVGECFSCRVLEQ